MAEWALCSAEDKPAACVWFWLNKHPTIRIAITEEQLEDANSRVLRNELFLRMGRELLNAVEEYLATGKTRERLPAVPRQLSRGTVPTDGEP